MYMENIKAIKEPKIVWVTRSFLDYRIPVYAELNKLCKGKLTIIYNGEVVPENVQNKAKKILGKNVIPMTGELKIKSKNQSYSNVANKGFRIPFQPNLIKTIRRLKPDVIVSDGFFQWTYAALWIRMFNMRRIKHVMCYEKTSHTERNAGKLRTWYRKFVSRWIDAIDCNGVLTKEYIQNLGYKKKLTLGHMTADIDGILKNIEKVSEVEIADVKNKYQLSGVNFIYVGRLIPLKGIIELLSAWKDAKITDASLMLVGDGEQRKDIEDYIATHNLNTVKLIGRIEYDKLIPYYKSADCFIIPTLEDNWSLVVPEAMACGLPIACSIYNGCHPELVKPENGWTFDPLNNENTIQMLKEIISNKAKLKEMGCNSKKIVSHHTPQHAAAGILEACKFVLNN